METLLKADLHVHTISSRDSLNLPGKIIAYALKRGIKVIGITDHNTSSCIDTMVELGRKHNLIIIPGIEIKTKEGELIAYYPEGELKPGLSLLDTIKMIRDVNGIIAVPHPLDRLRRSAIGYRNLERIIEEVDIIEVWNARTTFLMDNKKAIEFARRYKKFMSCGSDAHFPYEIGRSYILIPAFKGRRDFLNSLSMGILHPGQSPFWVHVPSTFAKRTTWFKRRFFNGELC